ncbi:MAG: hypothetical protein K6T34_11255 [Thermoflavifilum sp.]|nr:hypothetical protein [Thermoflavifilum sp.]
MVEQQTLLDQLVSFGPLIRNVLGEEVALSVSDTEKFLLYSPGKNLNHGVKIGDPVKPGTLTARSLSSGKREVAVMGPEVYGIPYTGKITCVRDKNNRVIGTFGIWEPTTKIESVKGMAENLDKAVTEIFSNSANMAATAEEIAATIQNLTGNAHQMKEDANKTDQILELIKEVAGQTHLLGLNAAIEAARAGEMGRGFSVVAEEIRKLASKTNSSVKEINDVLRSISSSIESLSEQISRIAATSEEQAAITQQINSHIQQIDKMSTDLAELSNNLLYS